MKKDDLLFGIIGLLLGFIVGYLLTTSYNQRSVLPAPVAAAGNAAPNTGGAPPDANEAPVPDAQIISAAQQRAQAESSNFDVQMQTGDVLYRARRYADAAGYFTKANELQPKAIEPMIALGNVYYDEARDNNANDKWPLSEKWYLAALVLEPKNINVRTDLGLTYVLRQPSDYDRAIKEFKQVLTENPKHEPALQNLVVAYTQQKKTAEAQATLAQLEKINPQNTSLPDLRQGVAQLK